MSHAKHPHSSMEREYPCILYINFNAVIDTQVNNIMCKDQRGEWYMSSGRWYSMCHVSRVIVLGDVVSCIGIRYYMI